MPPTTSNRVGSRTWPGTVAAGGFAAGRIYAEADRPGSATAPAHSKTNPSRERASLDSAISQASVALTKLLERFDDEEASGIVEFQLAMLGDDALVEPAYQAIENGTDASLAWSKAMEQAMAEYETADDPYFRARASDLADMRDRVLRGLEGIGAGEIPAGAIFVGQDLPPSRFLETDWQGGGIALFSGSANSHVAMLARSRGVPMLIDLEADVSAAFDGTALLDGTGGTLTLNPTREETALFHANRCEAAAAETRALQFLDKPAVTKTGERIAVMVNVAGPEDIKVLDPGYCDGVGLVRTEFLFHGSDGPPDEERQFAFYRDIVAWAGGRPVTLRTLDAGGDKPIPGLTVDGESNPFLGIRGLRLSLRQPEVFKVQLRAMLRAAAFGPVKIMLPMVTAAEELSSARVVLDEARAELVGEGTEVGVPSFGMMVEVPSAAIAIDEFDADFYSIGSNDLVQYVTACGRDAGGLGDLARSDCTAVLRLIAGVVRHGRATGREVSLCGDAAGDPAQLPRLLEAGLRVISVAPSALARTKAAVAAYQGAEHGER